MKILLRKYWTVYYFYSTKAKKIQFPSSGNKKYTAVAGHFDYSYVNKLLEHENYENYFILSYLRDPIKRHISNYYYQQRQKHLYAPTLLDYVQMTDPPPEPGNYWNQQTMQVAGLMTYWLKNWRTHEEQRFYLGNSSVPLSEDFIRQPLLGLALHNLRKMHLVGLTDRWKESACLIEKYLGVKTNIIKNLHSNKSNWDKISDEELEEAMRELTKRSPYDILIYNEAVRLFEEHLQKFPECRNAE